MKKRVLSLLLVLVMLLSLLPTAALAKEPQEQPSDQDEIVLDSEEATQDEPEQEETPAAAESAPQTAEDGTTVSTEDGTSAQASSEMSMSEADLKAAIETAEEGGTVTLTGNVELTGSLVIKKAVTLDLNGKSIIVNALKNGVSVEDGGNLTLNDSVGTGTITHGTNPDTGEVYQSAGVYIRNGTFTMNRGSITGNVGSMGGVHVDAYKVTDKSTFIMNGGTITGNDGTYAGGVYVYGSGATFIMNAGSITGNSITTGNERYRGGGVHVYDAVFTMTGGTISGNSSTGGGQITMFGGAGGVFVHGQTIPTVTVGGTAQICGNWMDGEKSGDVYVQGTGGTASNVALYDQNNNKENTVLTISTEKPLSSGANIGVTTKDTPDENGIIIASGADASSLRYFTSDAGYALKVDSGNLVVTSEEVHTHAIGVGTEYVGQDVAFAHRLTSSSDNKLQIDGQTVEMTQNSKAEYGGWKFVLPEGNYYLEEDLKLSVPLAISGTVNLCLNGKQIIQSSTISGQRYSTVIVLSGATLNIGDCRPDGTAGKITHASGAAGSGIEVRGSDTANGAAAGVLNLYNAEISGNEQSSPGNAKGGGVNNGGIFNMYGGTITDNAHNSGGGVSNSGTFTMYAGEITGNTASSGSYAEGGGVYNEFNKTFIMRGGSITGNHAKAAGASHNIGGVCNFGTFLVSGKVTISGNDGSNFFVNADGQPVQVDGVLDPSSEISLDMFQGTDSYKKDEIEIVVTGVTDDNEVCFKKDRDEWHLTRIDDKLVLHTTAEVHYHPVCGETCTHIDKETSSPEHPNVLWEPTSTLPTSSGNYYLTKSIELTQMWTVPKNNIVLDLNGRNITQTSKANDIAVMEVPANYSFTLTDCHPAEGDGETLLMGEVGHESTSNQSGRGVVVKGKFTLYNGGITKNNCSVNSPADRLYSGAGVYVDGGSFTMYGGKIADNYAINGAGVCVSKDGSAAMYGGTITKNQVVSMNYGSGVYLGSGTFDMYGGSISGNGLYATSAGYGGGVYVSGGSFNMHDGEITGNKCYFGGGVVLHSGSFNMDGGKISDNAVASNGTGGGVEVSGGAFTMTGGEISGNRSNCFGGGAYVGGGSFTMTGGKITGNTSNYANYRPTESDGGGMYVSYFSRVVFSVGGDAQITGNKQDQKTSNVYLSKDSGDEYAPASINVISKLSKDAEIGVTTASTPTESIKIAQGKDGYVISSDDRGHFTPDASDGNCVVFLKDKALYLGTHTHDWTYSGNEGTITASCDQSGCPAPDGGSVTISAPGSLVYDGNFKAAQLDNRLTTGDEEPVITYTKDGKTTTAPRDAGTYTASITLGKATASVEYTVLPADPKYTAPTDLEAVYGDTLVKVTLPAGWAWVDNTLSVGDPGENTFKATYTPSDANYKSVTVDLTVTVNKASVTITITGMPEGPLTYGDTFTLTLTQTGDERTESKNWQSPTHDNDFDCVDREWDAEKGELKLKFRAIGVCDGDDCSQKFSVTYSSDTHEGTATVSTPKVGPKLLHAGDFTYASYITKAYDGTDRHTGAIGFTLSEFSKVESNDYIYFTAAREDIVYAAAGVGRTTATMKMPASIVGSSAVNKNDDCYVLDFTQVTIPAEITKATLTAEGAASAGAVYGTAVKDIPVTGLTVKRADGTVVSGTWRFSGEEKPAVGNTKAYTAVFTPADGAENYEPLTKDIVPAITRAPGGTMPGVSISLRYTDRNDQTLQTVWSALLPAGQWRFEKSTSVGGNLLARNEIDSVTGTLIYRLNGNAKADGRIEWTITASCANYEDYTMKVTLTLTNRDPQMKFGFAENTVTRTYGDSAFTMKAAGAEEGSHVGYASSDDRVAVVDAVTGEVTILKAGTATITATASETPVYAEGRAEYLLTVKPKDVTVTAASKSIYVGAEAPQLPDAPAEGTDYTVEGLLEGDSLGGSISLRYAAEPDTTQPGETDILIELSGTGNENYNIRLVPGKLVVARRPSPGSSTPVYPVNTPSTADNGSVSASTKNAASGSTVTITVKPDSGYQLSGLTVTDSKGNVLTLTDLGNGKFSFTMPSGKVEVNATFAKEVEVSPFKDVAVSAYYYDAVKWAVKNGITDGVGNGLFAPNASCTRAQIVTFLWRAAGSPEPKSLSSFKDVAADSYYAKAVAWAVENGITTGTAADKFSPNEPCTRAQSVTFLFRAAKASATGAPAFSDVAANAYYAEAVKWAVDNGVTDGVGNGKFAPNDACTRAQIVTFLWRLHAGK